MKAKWTAYIIEYLRKKDKKPFVRRQFRRVTQVSIEQTINPNLATQYPVKKRAEWICKIYRGYARVVRIECVEQ